MLRMHDCDCQYTSTAETIGSGDRIGDTYSSLRTTHSSAAWQGVVVAFGPNVAVVLIVR